ncbi:MAG: hypothetical protein KGK30_06115 [Elusimicrobia bacterium]|nr:hypothetical protein [Elusimicrobiota bacterium]
MARDLLGAVDQIPRQGLPEQVARLARSGVTTAAQLHDHIREIHGRDRQDQRLAPLENLLKLTLLVGPLHGDPQELPARRMERAMTKACGLARALLAYAAGLDRAEAARSPGTLADAAQRSAELLTLHRRYLGDRPLLGRLLEADSLLQRAAENPASLPWPSRRHWTDGLSPQALELLNTPRNFLLESTMSVNFANGLRAGLLVVHKTSRSAPITLGGLIDEGGVALLDPDDENVLHTLHLPPESEFVARESDGKIEISMEHAKVAGLIDIDSSSKPLRVHILLWGKNGSDESTELVLRQIP